MIWIALTATILAVADETGFWETESGRWAGDIIRGLVAIGVIAAAWKGVRYMLTEVIGIKLWVSGKRREAHRREAMLEEMLSDTGWPLLTTEVHEIKTKLDTVHNLLQANGFHLSDHEEER